MADGDILWLPGYEKSFHASFPVKQTQLQQKMDTFEETGFKVVGIGFKGNKEYEIYVVNL